MTILLLTLWFTLLETNNALKIIRLWKQLTGSIMTNNNLVYVVISLCTHSLCTHYKSIIILSLWEFCIGFHEISFPWGLHAAMPNFILQLPQQITMLHNGTQCVHLEGFNVYTISICHDVQSKNIYFRV